MFPLIGKCSRERHGAGQREADRREVSICPLGCLEEALVHGWNAQEERARQAALGRQDQRGVELGEHRDCRAQAQARQEANREAEGVEKREDAVEDFGPFVKDRHPRD